MNINDVQIEDEFSNKSYWYKNIDDDDDEIVPRFDDFKNTKR
ncbi:MAG: hypothetical protein ACOCWG_04330 [bacterium]